jgi:hypothetical protein
MAMNNRLISMRTVSVLIITLVLLSSNKMHAEDLRKIVQLSGKWKFSIGDDKLWADPKFNDSNWDEISVPSKWEEQGYNDYNGYAWYRRTFTIEPVSSDISVYIVFGRIDDADEVYLNGKLVGKKGSFPPNYVTAYNQRRKYLIPHEYFNYSGDNLIAVKVYDSYLEGGIIDSPAGIYSDEDIEFLNLTITGKWKFHLGDNKQWISPGFDDNDWKEINVPQDWESEGYENYDGYAWYRKEFRVSSDLKDKKLYLSLGKIDDYDYTYLNGKLIGSVFDLEKDGDYRRKGYEYNARRIYKIPDNLLKINDVNIISVRVYDETLRGGIYEGPIGIMTEENYKKYHRKYYNNQPFWDYIIEQYMME